MSVLEGVLLEEINRLEKNILEYEKMLSSLPRGSIFIRQMGKSKFAYRKRKENGVVISEYLGSIDNDSVKKEIALSNDYKRISNNIRLSKLELSKLRKAYKVYG